MWEIQHARPPRGERQSGATIGEPAERRQARRGHRFGSLGQRRAARAFDHDEAAAAQIADRPVDGNHARRSILHIDDLHAHSPRGISPDMALIRAWCSTRITAGPASKSATRLVNEYGAARKAIKLGPARSRALRRIAGPASGCRLRTTGPAPPRQMLPALATGVATGGSRQNRSVNPCRTQTALRRKLGASGCRSQG